MAETKPSRDLPDYWDKNYCLVLIGPCTKEFHAAFRQLSFKPWIVSLIDIERLLCSITFRMSIFFYIVYYLRSRVFVSALQPLTHCAGDSCGRVITCLHTNELGHHCAVTLAQLFTLLVFSVTGSLTTNLSSRKCLGLDCKSHKHKHHGGRSKCSQGLSAAHTPYRKAAASLHAPGWHVCVLRKKASRQMMNSAKVLLLAFLLKNWSLITRKFPTQLAERRVLKVSALWPWWYRSVCNADLWLKSQGLANTSNYFASLLMCTPPPPPGHWK